MKKQAGFTLIEMVVVIVILGILAVTAAPRFLNLQADARESSLEGLKGAMAGSMGIVYGKAAIESKETLDASADATLEDSGIAIVYGYPAATNKGIGKAVEGLFDKDAAEDATEGASDSGDWVYKISDSKNYLVGFVGTDFGAAEKCYVEYKAATASDAPTITVHTEGC